MRSKRRVLWIFGIIAALFAVSLARSNVMADWRTASREPTGIAPDPASHPEAIAQVYSARAYGWRGMFGVHTWIAVKRENAPRFTIYEVLGWRVYRGGEAVSVSYRSPDSRWFDSEPEIIADVRGDGVNDVIDQIEAAVKAYPHNDTYTVWPGPNSNTFTAFVARSVPALRVDLPPTAIGKDYLSDGLLAATPSGTGGQFSLKGLLGVSLAVDEGLELNILGLTFGIDVTNPAIKLPLAGRLGFREGAVRQP